uniref:Ferritin n=1 Tax=Panagrolaimus superbus TaxID=310955 RepID=A0A914XZJ8_9BILA
MVSQIRQNYHENTENAVNTTVSHVLNASYHFFDLAYYFDRDDIALPSLHKYFLKLSENKREQADKLLRYQNQMIQ